MDHIYKQLRQFGTVKTEVPLATYTTFKIGGPATYLLTVDSRDMLVAAIRYLDTVGIDWRMLGGGSNMLVRDDGFMGVFIKMTSNRVHVINNLITADAGVPTVTIAQESMKAGLKGFEWGVGVPGTIGGAVRGNAGAMGKEMADDVYTVEACCDGEVVTYTNEACTFGYRDSRFKHSTEVVLSVTLALTLYDSEQEKIDSRKKMLEFLKYRNETQPKGFLSTGCIFKNVHINDQLGITDEQKRVASEHHRLLVTHFDETDETVQQFLRVGNISAGWLIEQAGMKGRRIGGAEVSPVHGNFIVNTGSATAEDVLALIEEIKEAVYTRYGMVLEEEVAII